MSKKSLIKELNDMSKEQLMELVLHAYNSRKDFKEYFEYFLNPQPDKIFEKSLMALDKECQRGNRGRSKIRISVIRKIIGEFAMFEPGDDYVCRLMLSAIELMFVSSRRYKFSDTLDRGFIRLLHEVIDVGDKAGMVGHVVDFLGSLSDSPRGVIIYEC